MPKEVLEEKSVTLAEVQEILKENEKKGELSYVQRVTLDYSSKFSQLPLEIAQKLVDELQKEFKLDLDTVIQIANCMPKSPSELRTVMGPASESLSNQDRLNDIVEIIKKVAIR
ncbi:MAG: RNA polymerase Rpb4 family protein [Candidatus Atabeyarchaeum deiterrae]